MTIASFARLGLANGFALVYRLGLASSFAFADRLGFTNGFALADRFSLSSRLVLTDMMGLFNILATGFVRDCFADVMTFADKLGLIVITIAIIV